MRFVGRSPELALLRRRYATALAGQGAVALVAGEAGIGKSALVEELRRVTTAAGTPTLTGRAVADEGAPALWPWRRLLTTATPTLSPELLDVEDATGDPAARFRMFDRTVDRLRVAAEPAGLVLVLDDLHWADDASLALLHHLAAGIGGARILVVGTFRDPDGAAALPERLAAICALSTVDVHRLGPLGVADIAAALGDPDPSWPAHIHRRTGGNPLFVRELTRILSQDGLLAGPAHDLPLPTELRRLIGYRLSRLSEGCQRLLGACSAIGDEVDTALLEAVAGDTGPLAEAVAAGILVDTPETPDRLRFSHAVVREARYRSLARAERLDLHRRIADVLAAEPPANGDPAGGRAGELARHRVRAAVGTAGRQAAGAACRAAAAEADRRRAPEEAYRWYAQCLRLSPAPDADLLLATARAAYGAGLIDAALATCERAADLATETGDPQVLAAAALVIQGSGVAPTNAAIVRLCERARAVLPDADAAGHARLLAQQAYAVSESESLAAAGPLSVRALALAERSDDVSALIAALHARHQVINVPETVAERLALGTRVRALAPGADRPDAALWGFTWRIEAQFQLGAMAQLDDELLELTAHAERIGWPVAWWHLHRARAARALIVGDFATAEAEIGRAGALAARSQDRSAYNLYYGQLQDLLRLTGRFAEYPQEVLARTVSFPAPIAWALYARFSQEAGDLDVVPPLLGRLRAALPTLPVDTRWLATVIATGTVAAGAGDTATTAHCYDLAVPYATYYLYSASGAVGALGRHLGVMAAALGRPDVAERHFADAIAMDTRIGALPFVALAQLDQADLLKHDPGRAAPLADRAGHTARRLGMAPAAARAAALSAAIAANRRAGPQLTARETEIAELVATGLANRVIADRLVLSERTVETHVRSILHKLGLTNRTQIAAWTTRTST